MKAKDFIEILKMSSIKGLAVGSSTKNRDYYDKQILTWLNIALTRLYSDLQLSQNGVEIAVIPDKVEYKLPDNSAGVILVRYASIMSADSNTELPLNNEEYENSLYTPRPKMIYIPQVYIGAYINVYYNETPEPLTFESDLPVENIFHQCLILYVAYLANELIHGSPNWEHQSFLTKYENEKK